MSLHTVARRTSVLISAVVVLLGTLVIVGTQGAQAGPQPAPTRIQIDSITADRNPDVPDETPTNAIPNLLVQVGDVITVNVTFWDGAEAAAFNKDTDLKVTTNVGSITVLNATAGSGATSAALTARVNTVANQVVVTVDDFATGKKAAAIAADSANGANEVFDILYLVQKDDTATGNYKRGIGGSQECTEATVADPVCGIVTFPFGTELGQVVLSTGKCGAANDAYAPCLKGTGVVLQVLAGMDGLGYGPSSPATLLVKCDKSLCGSGGIQKSSLNFSLDGNGNLQDVRACPAKGTLPVALVQPDPPVTPPLYDPCIDYVQSQRDGSGDTLLYFLFDRDARVSVG
jgi:hypothetical protein